MTATHARFRSDETIRLRDGRRLAFCEWGPIDGPAVFLFHGSPGSRVWCPNEAHTRAANVRLIVVDRPEYGRSEPSPGRTIGSWAVDILELCDLLRIERFGVIGVSAPSARRTRWSTRMTSDASLR